MTRNDILGNPAVKPRRRVVATALMYGLSLSVRLTSATGEEAEAPAQTGQSVMTSIMINDGARIDGGWPLRAMRPIAFLRGQSLDSGLCRDAPLH